MNKTAEPICESTDRDHLPQRFVAEAEKGCVRICLLGADYENSNLGIRALTTGALAAISAQFKCVEVKILDYGNAPRHYVFDLPGNAVPVEMLNIRFSKKLWVTNHIARLIATALLLFFVPLRSLRRLILSRNSWLQTLIKSDYVCSLNYGDSFSDIYGLIRFFYVSLPQVLAILLNRPLVQMPQTIGPFKSTVCRTIARWILARSVLIYTRDKQAVEKVRAMLPVIEAERVRFCHDLAFVLPPKRFTCLEPPLEKVFSRRPVVGFNVSGLLWMGGYTRDNMFRLANDYRSLVKRAIAHLIEAKGATVLLVPHLLWIRGEGDPPICNELFQELRKSYPDRIFTMAPPYDEREIKYVIGRCDFFVGARMHACIAALSQYVPAVGMAYSDKFIGVLRSVGLESTVADLRSLSVEATISVLSSGFDSRQALSAILRQNVPQARENVFGLLRGVAILSAPSD